MEDRSSEKLKSPMESLEQLNLEMGPGSSAQNHKRDSSDDDGDDLWFEDRSFSDGSDNGLIKASELDREWASRHNQFYTMASSQGKKLLRKRVSTLALSNQCVLDIIGALLEVSLDDLKEKLVGKVKLSERFQNLYGSVHSISSKVALKMFHDDILSRRSEQPQNKENVDVETMQGESSECNQLGRYSRELESLLHESPSIEVHAAVDQQTVG